MPREAGTVLDKNIWGQCPPPSIEAPEAPNGERRRRRIKAPNGAGWGMRGMFPLQPTRRPGEHRELPAVSGAEPKLEMHSGIGLY